MSMHAVSLCLALAMPQDQNLRHATGTFDTAAAAARVIRHIPIREWMISSRGALPPRLGSFLGMTDRGPSGQLIELGARRLVDPGVMVDLIRALRAKQIDDDPFSAIEVQGATLMVSGSPETVQALEDTARALTNAMVHDIQLRAALYRIPAPRDFPTTATRDQLESLTRDLHKVWEARGSCPSGGVTGLSKERLTSYVYDVDVEVAQDSKIGDPQTASLFEGVSLAVEPHALTKSRDLVLYCQFAFGEQRHPMTSRSTGVRETPSLDTPSVDTTSGVFSGRIENGGALLVAAQGTAGAGSDMLLVLTADHTARSTQDIGIYPVSALLSSALRSQVRNAEGKGEAAFPFALRAEDAQGLACGPATPDPLMQMIRNTVDLDSEDSFLDTVGGHIVVRGRQGTREAVAQIVMGLQDQWLRTTHVAATTTMHEVHFGGSVFPQTTDTAASGDAVTALHAISFPALVGRPHILVHGHETTSIRDVDVEIAQKAAISDPIVDVVFSGVILSSYVYPAQSGIGAEFELEILHTPTLTRRASETRDGGDLYLPELARARFRHGGPVPETTMTLGEGPTIRVGDKSYRTQQQVEIRVR